MKKKFLMLFLAGWLLAMVLPPQRVLGYLKGQK